MNRPFLDDPHSRRRRNVERSADATRTLIGIKRSSSLPQEAGKAAATEMQAATKKRSKNCRKQKSQRYAAKARSPSARTIQPGRKSDAAERQHDLPRKGIEQAEDRSVCEAATTDKGC
jgi:hypothetical protein